MKSADFRLIVVTHRPDVGNAVIHKTVVEEMHRWLAEQLSVDAIEVCYHRQSDGCDCRKPKPGMIWRAADRLGLDCARSFMIGDRASDIEAGWRAGCTTIFIDLGYVYEPPERPDFIVSSLSEATKIVLSNA
jgi:D-glycero-D-manno-heptose 1,7-bisphosphate phosphatase